MKLPASVPPPVPPPTPWSASSPPSVAGPTLSAAATLALLIQDGLVKPDTQVVDFHLSNQEFRVNGQLQPSSLHARYYQLLRLADTDAVSVLTITIRCYPD